jgi:hypothetical protein
MDNILGTCSPVADAELGIDESSFIPLLRVNILTDGELPEFIGARLKERK